MRKIYDICINILRIKNSNSCINTKDCEFQCSRFSKHSFEDYNNKTVIGLFDKTLNKFYVIRKIS